MQELSPGTRVLVENSYQKGRKGGKLHDRWLGPYIVHQNLGKGVYQLKTTDGSILAKKHNINRLKVSFELHAYVWCNYTWYLLFSSTLTGKCKMIQLRLHRRRLQLSSRERNSMARNHHKRIQPSRWTLINTAKLPLTLKQEGSEDMECAAALRAHKLRAKKRKLEQEEDTPPLFVLSSDDEYSQGSQPWKTIEGVELQEEDR